jgi:thioredoxin reductase (NADPH)
MDKEYELIIVGGGPAGLTAGIYAARNKLNTLLVEKALAGGLIAYSELVENYPGFPGGINGLELGELFHKQALKFNLRTLTAEVNGLEIRGKQKIVKTTEGELKAAAVIIAAGSDRIKLNVPGEEKYTGKGVSYCATCDGAFFRNKAVAVIGGGDSALYEALHLAKFASKVTIVHRRDQLRAVRIVRDRVQAETKIDYILSSTVDEILGHDAVEGVLLNSVLSGKKSRLDVSGVFVSVGQKPNTDYLKGVVPLDAYGYIVTNEKMQTAIPGVLAAGDIRTNSIRQAISAAGDGATAEIYAERYINE